MFIEPLYRTTSETAYYAVTAGTELDFSALPADRAAAAREALAHAVLPAGALSLRRLTLSLRPLDAGQIPGYDGALGHAEEYLLRIGENTEIIAPTEEGLIRGIACLQELEESKELLQGIVYSYPKYPLRGYRAFLPGRAGFGDFYRAVDLMARYQYNVLFLEIGGAMEYKSHPEINAAWQKSAARFRAESGLATRVQEQYEWLKNSIHADNGAGDILTHEECRSLIAYCNARGIEVIPEVPTLSHCDYLLLPHPEFAEQQADEHPDTYCPNHPGIYKYVFEVLDEIVDVFRPRRVHIGHDECYLLCVCPRCVDKDPVDLYVNDIIRIHDHLAKRGISTVMWGEKLLKAESNGIPIGGSEILRTRPDGTTFYRSRALYPCAERLPRDILMLHWYWPFDPAYDEVFIKNGYKMAFGNASFLQTKYIAERLPRSEGAVLSNWGSYAPEYMQRNMQLIDLLYNARLLAGHRFHASDIACPEEIDLAASELFRVTHRDFPEDCIEAVHTTEHFIPYKHFYDGVFIEDKIYLLGEYVLTFDDGTEARLPIRYGFNISYGGLGYRKGTVSEDPITPKDSAYRLSSLYLEVLGSSLPYREGDTLYYRTLYKNPHPGHRVTAWRYEPIKPDIEVTTVSLQNVKKQDVQ